ncbi:NIPSNAP domain-containing protein [Pseudomonas sp. IT-P74]
MRLFERITFTVRVRTVTDALVRIEAEWAKPEVGGVLMGCWASEIGQLNQIAVLRGYADEHLRHAERERYLPATFSPLQ